MDRAITVALIFSFIGLLDTTYLIYHMVNGTIVRCLFFPKKWCEKVQRSSYSKTFGIPNPVAGFGMYTAIIVLALLFMRGMVPYWTIQFFVGFGFAFSMYFLYIQAFVLKAFCTWCVVSAINFTVMAYFIFLA